MKRTSNILLIALLAIFASCTKDTTPLVGGIRAVQIEATNPGGYKISISDPYQTVKGEGRAVLTKHVFVGDTVNVLISGPAHITVSIGDNLLISKDSKGEYRCKFLITQKMFH